MTGLIIALVCAPVGAMAWLDRRIKQSTQPIANQLVELEKRIGSNGGSTVFDQLAACRNAIRDVEASTSDAQFLTQARRCLAPPERPLPKAESFREVIEMLDRRIVEELSKEQQGRKPA